MAATDGSAETPEQVFVLGRELAAARAAEDRHVRSGPSPLSAIDYPEHAGDLWRWSDCAADDVMASFVASYRTADAATRETIRAALTMDDLYTVLLYARRCAFSSIRAGDPAGAATAFNALSTIDIDRVDWRDVAVAAMLASYAASAAGVAPRDAVEDALDRATPRVAEVLADATAEPVDLSESCGYRVVRTTDGAVLFDDDYETYEPSADLASLVRRMAIAIEEDRVYRVDGLSLGAGMPEVWVDAEASGVRDALGRLTGCASVHGEPRPRSGEHFLLVYVGEAATVDDAAAIANAAGLRGHEATVIRGLATGRLFAVVIARCAMSGQPTFESHESMARFDPLVRDLLGSAAE